MAPVDQTPDASLGTGGFELIRNTLAFNKFPVFEYQSKRTGLTVVIAEIEGPILNGYFTLATEAFDDDGLPHTLEHLIFLGSEEYPYKGVLDLLANRCLASGTNAWTDTDHTCYTMDTAGSDGFLALMPIYLDHILFPVLTESSFVTEVHHITEKGDDAGVVYCEMQGRESSATSRLLLTIARAMYPGHCGYSSETGGIMKNLRESTDNTKVRNYHKEFYRPENLKVIITGIVNHADVFKQLEHIEEKLVNKGETTPFQRPWQNPVPPLPESRDLLVDYPADEEDNGMYCIAWRGPSAVNDQYSVSAMTILLKYLTDVSTYTLPKEFVEIDDPYASSVGYNLFENSVSSHCIMFEDVPLEKLSEIKPKLLDLFKTIVAEEDINMERMHSIIKRNQLELLSNTEVCPNNMLCFLIIGFVLYGNTKEDLEQRLNPLPDLDKLLQEPKSFWLNLFNKYFVEGNYVSVECRPSKNEHKRMDQEEAERIEKQKEQLGPAGLKEKGEILKNSIAFNTREPPIEMLTSVPIPSLASINFHNIERFRSDSEDKSKIDLSRTSVFTFFDHLKSEFVYMFAFLDSSRLPAEDRIYLPLILEALFESAIDKNGKIIPYEEVVEQINLDTVSFSNSIGVSSGSGLYSTGPYCQTLCVSIQVESGKYAKGLEWLRDIIYNTVFAADRLKIIATKMNNAVAQTKREGRSIAVHAVKRLRFIEDCNLTKNGVLIQNKFLTDLINELGGEQYMNVVSTCERIWKSLIEPKNLVLHLVGNLDVLKNPAAPLESFLPENFIPVQTKLNVIPDQLLLQPAEVQPLPGCVIGMGCLESAYFYQVVDCISSFEDPDLPALMLFLQYITQTEGAMFKLIRGKGYSYSYGLYAKPNEGLLYLVLAKASNVIGAYHEAREIIQKQIEEKQWESNLVDSAKSSLIFELIEKEKTLGSVSWLSVMSYFEQVDYKHNRNLISRVNNVTIDDLNRAGAKYLPALFDPKRVKTSIVCVPSKAELIANTFKDNYNLNLSVYPSLEESFLK